MEQKDYYTTLGVEKLATQKRIKEAYRRLALQYHPDRNRTEEASSKMKEINEAYAVLSDPQKRRSYDALEQQFGSSGYSQFRQSHSDEEIFRGSDIRQVYEEISKIFGLRGFDEIFREYYGPGYQNYEFRRPGFSTRGFVFHTFPGKRPVGGGAPVLGGPIGKLLKYALKKQWGIEFPEKGKDRSDRIVIPPALARTGGKFRYFYRLKSRELIVTIPPGIRDGQKIRLRGMGEKGKGGGEPGDLYVTVYVRGAMLGELKALWASLLSRVKKALR